MMRSMYSAVAGLRTHQTKMDVIGDNIANVNTSGFKKARVTFQDTFYQTLRGGSAADLNNGIGGTSPHQIGLGSSLGSIDVIHTQGAPQSTGKGTDLMIQGSGFFVVNDSKDGSGNSYYTRAGAFDFDNEGNLVNLANGLYVSGFDTVTTAGDAKLIEINGVRSPIKVPTDASSYSINSKGEVYYIAGRDMTADECVDGQDHDKGTAVYAGTIAVAKFANPAGLQKAGQSLYTYDKAAGNEAGEGNSFGTGGTFTPEDFIKYGGIPSDAGRGSIVPGTLEMSNVDLAQEFTEMIVTQRGFQANSKTITTSDEMLQELMTLKR